MITTAQDWIGVPDGRLHAAIQFTVLGLGVAAALRFFQSSFFSSVTLVLIALIVLSGIFVTAAREWVHAILWSGLVVFGLVRPFVVEAYYIPSRSMENTLQVNDHLLVNKTAYYLDSPERWEIIVFRPPHEPDRKYIKRIVGMPGDTVVLNPDGITINGRHYDQPTLKTFDKGRIAREADHRLKFTPTGRNDRRKHKRTLQIPPPGKTVDLSRTTTFERRMYAHLLKGRTEAYVEWRGDTLYRNDKPVKTITVEERFYFVLGDHRTDSKDSRYWGFLPESSILGRSLLIYWPPSRIKLL